MAQALLIPQGKSLYSAAALAATANSGAVQIDLAEAYLFILDASAGTGTTPTLDVAIQVTPDDGTTWYSVLRFAQVTTGASKQGIRVQPTLGRGEAGSQFTIADTGGAQNANVPFSKKVRVVATVAGTNPAYATVKVWMVAKPAGNMDV